MLTMIGWLASSIGFASEHTEMAPMLRGDISATYQGDFFFSGIDESGTQYGQRSDTRHRLQYALEFSPVTGLALTLTLPHTVYYSRSFSDGYQMESNGTYKGSESLGTAVNYTGNGYYKELEEKGLVVLFVSTDDPRTAPQVKPFVKRNKYQEDLFLLDKQSKVVAMYNPAKTLPFGVLIGKNFEVIKKYSGYNPGDEETVLSDIQTALTQE